MSVYEGRFLETPSALRSSVARIRALDRMPPARGEIIFRGLPTVSSTLVVVTPSEGAPLKVLVAGPTTAAKYKMIVPAPSFVQLRFEPWAARAVFGVPLHELVDRVVPIDEIWGRAGRDLLDALAPLEGRSRVLVATLEGSLSRRLDREKPAAPQRRVSSTSRGCASRLSRGAPAIWRSSNRRHHTWRK